MRTIARAVRLELHRQKQPSYHPTHNQIGTSTRTFKTTKWHDTMPSSQFFKRSRLHHNSGSISGKTGTILAITCVVIALIVIAMVYSCRKCCVQPRDPEALRAEQRRENGGWWGNERRSETAVERRVRMAQAARESREARVLAGQEAHPPMHQLPAPAYCATPTSNPTQQPVGDMPPPYNSTAVWPTRR